MAGRFQDCFRWWLQEKLGNTCFEVLRVKKRRVKDLRFRHIGSAMPIPSLPYETTEMLILLAVADLVEQERNQATPLSSPISNAFSSPPPEFRRLGTPSPKSPCFDTDSLNPPASMAFCAR